MRHVVSIGLATLRLAAAAFAAAEPPNLPATDSDLQPPRSPSAQAEVTTGR